jgi:RimJ/RimL family protein N-acetyltransferase
MGGIADFSREVRVELRGGRWARVRPIRPEDKAAIALGFQELSERSRYQRFMTAINELSESQLRYLTEVDHHDHEALVAFDEADGAGVGVARFVRLPDGVSAEAAVTIIDRWQGVGLGTVLCNMLAGRAREEGIERFTALLLADNEQMHDVLASLGPSKVLSRDAGTVQVEVEIPQQGIGEHMAGVLRVVAGGTVELATPPWGIPTTGDG